MLFRSLTVTGAFDYSGLVNVPPIWIDEKITNDGLVVQEGLTEAIYLTSGKTQLFFVPASHAKTVSFAEAGYEPIVVAVGSIIKDPIVITEPTKLGHVFVEWRAEGLDVAYDFTQPITESVNLVAHFQLEKFTLTFKVEGEEDVVVTQDYGSAVTAPTYNERIGYTFAWIDTVQIGRAHV